MTDGMRHLPCGQAMNSNRSLFLRITAGCRICLIGAEREPQIELHTGFIIEQTIGAVMFFHNVLYDVEPEPDFRIALLPFSLLLPLPYPAHIRCRHPFSFIVDADVNIVTFFPQ